MTPTETIAILRQFNEWRRGCDIEHPPTVGKAIDAAIEMIDRFEAAEKAVNEAYQRGYATGQEESEKERDALRAKIEAMEKQEPVGVVQWIKGWPVVNAHDGVILEPNKPLYALPGAHPAPSVPDDVKEGSARFILQEHARKLAEVWGKVDDPYAIAYGWIQPMLQHLPATQIVPAGWIQRGMAELEAIRSRQDDDTLLDDRTLIERIGKAMLAAAPIVENMEESK